MPLMASHGWNGAIRNDLRGADNALRMHKVDDGDAKLNAQTLFVYKKPSQHVSMKLN